MAKSNPHTGSRFDDFLKEAGIYDEVQARALKRALAEQIGEGMQAASLTKKTVVAALNVTAHIARQILVIRGQKVMIDADLAALYDVPTKRLNEQVKRNPGRFPGDFVFALTRAERDEVVANCDHLQRLKFSPTMPFAFTEHGALMAASVLNTPRAVEESLYVVRAFVELREPDVQTSFQDQRLHEWRCADLMF